MTAVLLDTHTWAWSLAGDDRLSKPALAAIEAVDTVLVSPITFFEIAQKVRLGKWPEMEPFVGRLTPTSRRRWIASPWSTASTR